MSIKNIALSLTLGALMTSFSASAAKPTYEQNWNSLSKHDTPQWLLDAKFGIYSHWGPQTLIKNSVPRGSMTNEEAWAQWKGEAFDAKEWAAMYKDAGAQFAGYLANHGSGCLNWDADVSDWNITNHGPKRDLLGEIISAVRAEGMHTMASFHSVTADCIWGQMSNKNRTYHEPDFTKKEYQDNRQGEEWMEGWNDRIMEAVTKYNLDMIWFDVSFGRTVGAELGGFMKDGKYIPDPKKSERAAIGGWKESGQQRVLANYFNWAEENNRDVEVVYKAHDIPVNVGMRDIEDGNLNGSQYDPWMTDIDMTKHTIYPHTWFYHKDEYIKDANVLIDILIDVTSKNGRMLLSVPAQVDGSFSTRVKAELKKMGEWLRINGEGIYGSTPWCVYGEGPSEVESPGHHGHDHAPYVETFDGADIRYTSKGDDLYAFVLGMPRGGQVKMATLGSNNKLYPNEIKSVTLLGNNNEIKWKHEPDGLVLILPKGIENNSFAYCFKIERNK